jgi:hypothetical protein
MSATDPAIRTGDDRNEGLDAVPANREVFESLTPAN